MMAPSWRKELGILMLALACVSLLAWGVHAHWTAEQASAEEEEARLCFYSPVMLFPWIPALCVLLFLAWKSRT